MRTGRPRNNPDGPRTVHLHNQQFCPRGHELTLENKRRNKCKICNEIDAKIKQDRIKNRQPKRREQAVPLAEHLERMSAKKKATLERRKTNPRDCDHPDTHPVTRENTARGGLCALCHAARTINRKPKSRTKFCKRGHERTPENTDPFGNCRVCKRFSDERANAKRPKPKRITDEDFQFWRDQIRKWGKDGIRTLFRLKSDEEMRRIFAKSPGVSRRKHKRSGQLEKGDTEGSVCGLPVETPDGCVAVEPGVRNGND